MSSSWKAAAALLLLAGVLSIAWTINHYRNNAITFKDQRDKATHGLKLANDTIADMKVRQRDVAALDAKYTKELTDAKAENAILQRKLDNGSRVLVKGRCPVPAATQTTGTSVLGNDATIELSDVAGRNVLGIRSGIISDQKSLKVLQEYINTQCLK